MQRLASHEISDYCPYCGSSICLVIDSSLDTQQYIEDCEVCCRPISIHINWQDEETMQLSLLQENDVY